VTSNPDFKFSILFNVK